MDVYNLTGGSEARAGAGVLLPSSRGCGCPSSLVTPDLAVQLNVTTWQAKAAGSAAAKLFPAGPRAAPRARARELEGQRGRAGSTLSDDAHRESAGASPSVSYFLS